MSFGVPKFFLIAVVLIFSSVGWSMETYGCKRAFRIGALNNEPVYFPKGTRSRQGLLVELIEELKRRTGCKFEAIESTRPMLISNLRSSSIDFTLLSIKTPSMDEVASFIPIYLGRRAVVMSPSLKEKNTSLEKALSDKKVFFGALIGSSTFYTPEEIKILRKDQRLIEFTDYRSMFTALKKGRVQATIGSYPIVGYFVTKMNLSDYSFQVNPVNPTYIGAYYNHLRFQANEVQFLTKVLGEIYKDGTLAKIYREYIPKEIVQKTFAQ